MVSFFSSAYGTEASQLNGVDATERADGFSYAVESSFHGRMVETSPRKQQIDDPIGQPISAQR
jgi:hypothetical protein